MKRIILTILGTILAVLLLAGCSNNETYNTTVECNHEYTSNVAKESTYESTGIMLYVCEKCEDAYTEEIEKLTKHILSTEVLDAALSKAKYHVSSFSISVGKLVNAAMDYYEIEYLTGEEAIAQGYLSTNNIDETINIDNLYYAIISGDCMQNPAYPYMTEYEQAAVTGWLLFDDNDKLMKSGISVCENLHTCAVFIMTSSY